MVTMNNNTSISERAVLVTGGAHRIGRTIALSLAENGWNIALHYHTSQQEAESTAQEIYGKGVLCELFHCDLSCESDVSELIPAVVRVFPGLSLLVNNASLFEKKSIAETDNETLDRIWSVNLKAPVILMRDFARICSRGQIITIIDALYKHGDYHYAAYFLTKNGLAYATQLAAKEFGPGIRVNAVAPGIILPPDEDSPAFMERNSRLTPLKRKGTPEDIAQAVRFLIEHTFITGHILYVDGGEHL